MALLKGIERPLTYLNLSEQILCPTNHLVLLLRCSLPPWTLDASYNCLEYHQPLKIENQLFPIFSHLIMLNEINNLL